MVMAEGSTGIAGGKVDARRRRDGGWPGEAVVARGERGGAEGRVELSWSKSQYRRVRRCHQVGGLTGAAPVYASTVLSEAEAVVRVCERREAGREEERVSTGTQSLRLLQDRSRDTKATASACTSTHEGEGEVVVVA